MEIIVLAEKFKKSESGMWRFNVYWEIFEKGCERTEEAIGGMEFGWGFKDNKLYPPFTTYNGKTYTTSMVNKRLAKLIYKTARNAAMELEGIELPYSDAGWRCGGLIGQSSFKTFFPEYYAEIYGKNLDKKLAE